MSCNDLWILGLAHVGILSTVMMLVIQFELCFCVKFQSTNEWMSRGNSSKCVSFRPFSVCWWLKILKLASNTSYLSQHTHRWLVHINNIAAAKRLFIQPLPHPEVKHWSPLTSHLLFNLGKKQTNKKPKKKKTQQSMYSHKTNCYKSVKKRFC